MRLIINLLKKIIVIFFSGNIFAVASAQVNSPLTGEPPKFVVGDTWKYKKTELPTNRNSVQIHKVMAISNETNAWIFIENITTNFKTWWLYDSIKGANVSTYSFDASKLNYIGKKLNDVKQDSRLQHPLYVGKKYKLREYWNNEKTGFTDFEITVTGIEEITTKAGTFTSWKLLAIGDWQDKETDTVGQTRGGMWYSPEVKRWVKTEFIGTSKGKEPSISKFELIEWTPGN